MKLDLWLGYHQIGMHPGDIKKQLFACSKAIMYFWLCHLALQMHPPIFKAWWMRYSRNFFRKFVLVFFYDILILSKSLEEHLYHVHCVLHILQANQFFVKWGGHGSWKNILHDDMAQADYSEGVARFFGPHWLSPKIHPPLGLHCTTIDPYAQERFI